MYSREGSWQNHRGSRDNIIGNTFWVAKPPTSCQSLNKAQADTIVQRLLFHLRLGQNNKDKLGVVLAGLLENELFITI